MNYTVKYPIALATVFIWIGFVGAISFMEAWLKFQAPGITIPLGLGIGRLVFDALNKMELIFAMMIIASILYRGVAKFRWEQLFFAMAFLIVSVQTIWLLPALDTRAELHIQGLEVPASNLHFFYIAVEVVKVICLLIFGFKLLKK